MTHRVDPRRLIRYRQARVVVAGAVAVALLLAGCTSHGSGSPPRTSTPAPSTPSSPLTSPPGTQTSPATTPPPTPGAGTLHAVDIPGATSGFPARPAEVWVPRHASRNTPVPVLMLMHGTSGGPTDWVTKGHLVSVLDAFAVTHHGQTPLVVMPDINGMKHADTECVRTKAGADVEDYLEHDVPAYIATHYPVLGAPAHWAVGGLSEGGLCGLMLALRDPAQFSAFVDLSGLLRPSITDYDNPVPTTAALFGGSTKLFDEHSPLWLMAQHAYPGMAGWFECGAQDTHVVPAQARLVAAAKHARISVTARMIPGSHSWQVWQDGLAAALPWLWSRLLR